MKWMSGSPKQQCDRTLGRHRRASRAGPTARASSWPTSTTTWPMRRRRWAGTRTPRCCSPAAGRSARCATGSDASGASRGRRRPVWAWGHPPSCNISDFSIANHSHFKACVGGPAEQLFWAFWGRTQWAEGDGGAAGIERVSFIYGVTDWMDKRHVLPLLAAQAEGADRVGPGAPPMEVFTVGPCPPRNPIRPWIPDAGRLSEV